MKSSGLFLVWAALLVMLSACGAPAPQMFTPTASAATEAPATREPQVATPAPTAGPPQALSVEEQLRQVDDILKQSARASIAYNAPAEMRVDETVTIELLLNPRQTEDDLKKQISEPGALVSSSVEITPLMKARLVPQDDAAFFIEARPDEQHAVQVISGQETTKWSWNVKARKPGTQRLTISLSRMVKYGSGEFWREVGEYEADILVQVTPLDWLKTSGWKWIGGLFVLVAGLFVLSRRNGRRKEAEQAGQAQPHENLGRIFISYRRSDSADIAGRIYDRLVDEFGRETIFKDVDSIPLGIDFKEHLDQKIRECKIVLAILGDHWLDATDEQGKKRLEDPTDFVRIEIESALARDVPVIPLLVRGAKMPEEASLPPGLRKLVYKNGVQIRPDPDFHRDMDRLSAALKKYVG